MADAIRALCADPARAGRMAEAGRIRALADFTVDTMTNGLLQVVAEVTVPAEA
jgi:hypothetical protein